VARSVSAPPRGSGRFDPRGLRYDPGDSGVSAPFTQPFGPGRRGRCCTRMPRKVECESSRDPTGPVTVRSRDRGL